MSTLKKAGRKVRRIRAAIAKMHPEKLYTISGDGKAITLTGAQWKASTKPKADVEGETSAAKEGEAQH